MNHPTNVHRGLQTSCRPAHLIIRRLTPRKWSTILIHDHDGCVTGYSRGTANALKNLYQLIFISLNSANLCKKIQHDANYLSLWKRTAHMCRSRPSYISVSIVPRWVKITSPKLLFVTPSMREKKPYHDLSQLFRSLTNRREAVPTFDRSLSNTRKTISTVIVNRMRAKVNKSLSPYQDVFWVACNAANSFFGTSIGYVRNASLSDKYVHSGNWRQQRFWHHRST